MKLKSRKVFYVLNVLRMKLFEPNIRSAYKRGANPFICNDKRNGGAFRNSLYMLPLFMLSFIREACGAGSGPKHLEEDYKK